MSAALWQPIVVGVDSSHASIAAVQTGSDLARAAKTTARFVHATPEAWTVPAAPHPFAVDADAVNAGAREAARSLILQALAGKVPPAALERLEARSGTPSHVIHEVADEVDAGLVVVGGKHHSTLGRWVVGSTAHALVRSLDRPMLVVARSGIVRRILVAVDLSDAASPTIHAAEAFADLLGATLRVVHVVEPVPIVPETPMAVTPEEILAQTRTHLERYVWPLVSSPGAETVVRHGPPVETIAAEAATFGCDLVVVGSHGKRWVDRMLIGSVTERLLEKLPTSVLVVPISAPARVRRTTGDRELAISG